jgi:pimeloyl-ACP methyl ester carboxylesterase
MSSGRKRWVAGVVAIGAVAAAIAIWPTVGTVALLVDLGGWTSFPRPLVPVRARATTAETLSIPTRHGSVMARVDWPDGGSNHTLVVLPGIHAAGLDEPRLTRFSTRLAGAGINVVSVPLPDLRAFRIVGRSTDQAEDVAAWVAANPRLAPKGRISLAGVSFAGGLALVAAGRPALGGRLDAAVSLGGHGDLGAVLEYLCTGRLPDGTARPPHDYSLAVVALAAVPHLVPSTDVMDLERGIVLFLSASADESPGRTQTPERLAEAVRLRDAMPARSRQIMDWVLNRQVAELGRAIQPFIGDLAKDPSLSPERSPATTVPVYLLQGQGDSVIPPSETPRLAAYLERHGNRRVRWLLTPVLSHVGVDAGVPVADWWRMIRFWRDLEDAIKDSSSSPLTALESPRR